MDLIGPLISMIVPIIIVIFCFLYFTRMIKEIAGPAKRKQFSPQNVGDRMKKYIFQAAKANPSKAKVLKLRRTKFNEGGTIGTISGIVTTGDVTRFVFRKTFGRRQVLYCPTSMHSSLHHREVFIDGISLENLSGFFFPVPYEGANWNAYTMTNDAFKKDIKRLQRMDIQQIELEETAAAMIGEYGAEDIIRRTEDLPLEEVDENEQYA